MKDQMMNDKAKKLDDKPVDPIGPTLKGSQILI